MSEKGNKRSFDCPEEYYNYIMEYAIKNKLYKFGIALVSIIKEHKENNK